MSSTNLWRQWEQRVSNDPDAPALTYFTNSIAASRVHELCSALAEEFAERGVRAGARVGLCMQNIPQFPIALFALWKLGAIAVLINPMYRQNEMRHILADSGMCGVVAERSVEDMLRSVAGDQVWIMTTTSSALLSEPDKRRFDMVVNDDDTSTDHVLSAFESPWRDYRPAHDSLPDDAALLTYTSGTTGPPKGAVNTHEAVLTSSLGYARLVGAEPHDSAFALAPLFHITGAVLAAGSTLLSGGNLVLADRFHAERARRVIVENHVSTMIGAITAYSALADGADGTELRSLRAAYSGGAPIPPALVERFEQLWGVYIHNAYGMTETAAGVVGVPLGQTAPVDPVGGSLSVGKALPGVEIRVVDSAGLPLPPNGEGELQIRSPQVMKCYWQNPEATQAAIAGGWLSTGDGARINEDGWLFIIDRLKDQINVSGYKVWPREVEDVLCEHAAVAEAAVVGRPDPYQGEAVTAFVALVPGATVEPAELRDFVRQNLAAYKVPSELQILDALPKTATGKIRRNVLQS